MNPSQKERLPLRLEKLYREIGELMMEDIVRRILKTKGISSTADYQINRLILLGATSEEIEKEIQKRTQLALAEMYEMYDNVINWEYVRNKDIYEQINSEFIPWEENYQLQQISEALIEQTKNELINLTQSMGFAIEMNGKIVFTPLSEYYQKYLDQTLLGIVTGAFDYNSALRKCITQMVNSGIRTVDYASGHSNRIEVAARRAVMTGIAQLTGKISDYNAQRLGTDYFEVAWHSGARNTGSGYLNHQSWQGRVYTRQQLIEICGLGLGGGLEGWNCRHERYPFFPGISERNWTDEWLDAKNLEENTPKIYNGNKYNAYQATQKQRQMETAMRTQREKIQLLQKGNADTDMIMNERIKYQLQLDEYSRFSKQMGLVEQRERIYLDMRGRIAPGYTKGYANSQKNGRINITDKQLGKKIGKHTKEYGLDPSKKEDRDKMKKIIHDILNNPDEIRTGEWRGQGEKIAENGNKKSGKVNFYIKGNDVVVVNGNEFVTILKDGLKNSERVKNAKKVK